MAQKLKKIGIKMNGELLESYCYESIREQVEEICIYRLIAF